MTDKRKQTTDSPKPNESNHTIKELNKIKTLDVGKAQGFTCDAETGICGPIDQEKEENK